VGFGGHINWFPDTVVKWNLITSLSQLPSTAICPSRKERKRERKQYNRRKSKYVERHKDRSKINEPKYEAHTLNM
jgi:hypothetical protein